MAILPIGDGIAAMPHVAQVEIVVPDGTRLVTVRKPARGADDTNPPGAATARPGDPAMNEGRAPVVLTVSDTSDQPVPVSSRHRSFEADSAPRFVRASARGFRFDVPAGPAMRFEPGRTRDMQLVSVASRRKLHRVRRALVVEFDDP